ncbi:MAG: Holliday junction resolvase RuvX [Ignavibacteriae bacterium]|nr:MAG: Holliday junction resolvase RuvX [Ignavibacteriota bacterium]
MSIPSDAIRGKRLLALDYGDARIGVAVCDELHIVVSTRPVINNDATMWDVLLRRLADDRIDVVIVGVPRKLDDTSSPIIERILAFIAELKQRTVRPVFDVDEAFTTQRARELMISSGTSKKRRSAKGTKDQVAAAIILQDVIDESR